MTKSKLQKLTKLWQERLKLGDWRLEVILDPNLADHGNVVWDDITKEATIRLYPAKDDARLEKVLIHELLHLVLKKWRDDVAVEETIYHLTSVLYDLTHDK